MKVLVPIKRVVDYQVKVQPTLDGSALNISSAKCGINPFDEIALEQAMRWKEAGRAQSVIAITIGSAINTDILKQAYAFGVDDAVLLETNAATQPLGVAHHLAAYVRDNPCDLIIMGKQAIDDDFGQTGPMLASLLEWPQALCASNIHLLDNGQVRVISEVESGVEESDSNLPMLITTDLRLNQPRLLSLPKIMRARSKVVRILPIEIVTDIPTMYAQHFASPQSVRKKIHCENIEVLYAHLKKEGIV